MRFVPKTRWLAPFVLVSVLAACSSGSGSSNSTNAAPNIKLSPQLIYVGRADQICQRYSTQRNDADTLGNTPSNAAIKRFVHETVVPSFRKEIAELRALRPPSGEARKVNAVWDALAKGVDELQKSVDRDPQKMLRQPPPGILDAASRAKAYGFERCGSA